MPDEAQETADAVEALITRGDHIEALCRLVAQAGGQVTLHGKPVDAAELRQAVTTSAADRMAAVLGVDIAAVCPPVPEDATVACSECSGTGRRALTPCERRTLGCVPVGDEWATTPTIRRRLALVGDRPSPQATANRLADLRRLGLVESRLAGRAKEWRRRP
jgi:hypothetical protein